MQETQVRSLGREEALKKEMAIHSSILAWKIPCTEEPRGPQSRLSHYGPLYYLAARPEFSRLFTPRAEVCSSVVLPVRVAAGRGWGVGGGRGGGCYAFLSPYVPELQTHQ